MQKFYFAGTMTIAVRTLENGTDVLNWVLGDHLGSTSTTANADGSLNSVIQYTAYGEIRLTHGVTPTKYRYTGQLAQAELGLDYYVARWYGPMTGHFTQADTIIPEPGKSQSFDRYAYVMNNPLRYVDPSGNKRCDDEINGKCVQYQEKKSIVPIVPETQTEKNTSGKYINNNAISGFANERSVYHESSQLRKFDKINNHERIDAQTPFSNYIRNEVPFSAEDWTRIGISLDISAEILDLYAVGVVITGGIIGAGITSPSTLAGAPEIPIVTGAFGAAIAEIYVQNVLSYGNMLATGGTFAAFISDTKAYKTEIETGKIANSTSNSIIFSILGCSAPEAFISFTFQTTVLLNDLGMISIPVSK